MKKKKVRVYKNSDAFGYICQIAECRAYGLPSPLPWIGPSINMLYLECVFSYIIGNEFSSIISMSTLLEHVLRLVLLDKDNTGLTRSLSLKQLDDINSIIEAIKKATAAGFIEAQDKPW